MHKMFALLKGFNLCYFDYFSMGTICVEGDNIIGEKSLYLFNYGSGDNFSYSDNIGYGYGNNMGACFGNGYGDGTDSGNGSGNGSSLNERLCLAEQDA